MAGCQYGNIEIKKTNRLGFIEDLRSCGGVISTAGFTLISEATYLGKPMFCIPLPTYDQKYCAKYISDHAYGCTDGVFSPDNIKAFLNNLEWYRTNMRDAQRFFDRKDPLESVVRYVESLSPNVSKIQNTTYKEKVMTTPNLEVFYSDAENKYGNGAPFYEHDSKPYRVTIKPTMACPARCPHCEPRQKKFPQGAQVLSLNDWGNVFQELKELGTESICISGGE